MNSKLKLQSLRRRQTRVRAKISGTAKKPRLSASRSLSGMYVQLIDDENSKTLLALNTKKVGKGDAGDRNGKVAKAYLLGKEIADKAKSMGIEEIVFDRRGNRYMGRIQAVADGAREGGLKF